MSINECRPLVYNSSDSGAEEEAVAVNKRIIQKRSYSWLYKQTFENPTDAQSWLDDQRIWSAKTTHDTEAGRRVQYRCNQVPYRGQQCAAAMHLVYNSDSTKVNLYLSDY